MIAHVHLSRTDDNGKQFWQEFEVPCDAGARVAEVLEYIHEHLDPSVAYRKCFCKRGLCGLCVMVVNGRAVKTCKAPVSDVIRIEPLHGQIIRDVVTVPDTDSI